MSEATTAALIQAVEKVGRDVARCNTQLQVLANDVGGLGRVINGNGRESLPERLASIETLTKGQAGRWKVIAAMVAGGAAIVAAVIAHAT